MKKLLIVTYLTLVIVLSYLNTVNAQISTGLVGYWTFDEGSGNTAGDSAGSNTGTLVNNPTWLTGTNAKVGSGALSFDGVDDYVDITGAGGSNSYYPALYFPAGSPWTFSSWIYFSSNVPLASNMRYAGGKNNAYATNFVTRFAGNNNFGFFNQNSSSFQFQSNSSCFQKNVWCLVTWVADSSNNITLYVNGANPTTIPVTNSQLVLQELGRFDTASCTPSYCLTGSIDDVRVYNRALSADEIAQLYTYTGVNPIPPVQPPIDPAPVVPPVITPTGTYYVSTTGNDNNPGTESSPFRTIQKAANIVTSGGNVFVRSGTYEEFTKININGSGSYINFQPYSGEKVLTRGFGIKGKYISIKGFEIANVPIGPNNSYGSGITIDSGSSDIQIIGNYIHDTYGSGVFAVPSGPVSSQYSIGTNNLIINNNTIYKVGSAGLAIFANNVSIENNEISFTTSYWNGVSRAVDADGLRLWGNGFVVRNNYIHDMLYSNAPVGHNDCLQTWDSDYPPLSNVLFEHNFCENIDSEMIQFEGQYKHLSNNITFKNNIFYLSPGATMNNHGVTNVFWYNNDIISSKSLTYVQGASGIIKNNIFYNLSTDWVDWSTNYYNENPAPVIIGDYNVTYSNITYPGHPTMPHDKNADPLFVNINNIKGPDGKIWTADDGLMLKSGSPSIDSGENGVDIGAYEYTGVVTPPTPIIGDFNNDRLVNSLDFSLLVSAWNQNNATYDINHDGIVNSLDYVVMVQNWTQ